MKNLKTTMIAALLMLATVGGVVAQEKWEYAKVFAWTGGLNANGIYVTISGKEAERIEVDWKAVNKYVQDVTPFLNYIEKMTEEGWEVITVDSGTYYLKRKKK
jgi:hypothetical protein